MAHLETYRAKRHFDQTPEPKEAPASDSSRLYVIQKHDASHLHYDFRLEHNGVLLSWAVPKGPSEDPTVKRLAVHVEDHPVSYGSFEGTIPKGQYGAGTVEIWDTGTWRPLGDVDQMLKKGELKFEIDGKRLHGRWVLVQFKDDEKNWLLIKERDAEAPITFDYRSFQPQLATLAESVPTGSGWIHEVKFDGYRILAWHLKGRIHLMTRGGQDWTERFPEIAETLKERLADGTALDGEVVVFDTQGVSDFGALQRWLKDGKGPFPSYMAFDLIQSGGKPMTGRPLLDRKKALAEILNGFPDCIRLSTHEVGNGLSMMREACHRKLEGLVSKQADAPYVQRRTTSWVKNKCALEEEVVIGGYTRPEGEREAFGAILVGQFNPAGELEYAGKVGTGFDDRDLKDLLARMQPLRMSQSPFAASAKPPAATWIRPELVAQVRYAQRTQAGMLRQAVFLGLREDKEAKEVTPEPVEKPLSVKITHPERMLYPAEGVTKQALAEYYQRVADLLLPFIKDRPLALVRCPEGPEKQCFFQKHLGAGMPNSLGQSVEGEPEPLLVANDETDLLELIQFGVIELHGWGSTVRHIEEPDLMVFDLDPGPDVEWRTVLEATSAMGEYLKTLGFKPFAKLSGGNGFHVVAPIKPGGIGWDHTKSFTHAVASMMDELIPNTFVTVASKAKRKGRIYIDYLRNGRGATSIVPYSARANPEAAVSAPVAWADVMHVDSPRQFRVSNADEWLTRPTWQDFSKAAVNIPADSWKKVGLEPVP